MDKDLGVRARRVRLTLLVGSLVALGLAEAPRARAVGMEDTVTGATTLGRAAGYARVHDFMAVWQNPANLALVPGRDVGFELRLPLFDGCFDREPDPRQTYLATESFDRVCNSAPPLVAGSLGFALALPRGFGLGFGLYTPGGVGKVKYGNGALNTVNPLPNETATPTSGVRETASRYLIVDEDALLVFAMLGVGYEPVSWLRLGVSAGSGFMSAHFRTVTSAFGGLFDDQAFLSDIDVTDPFVPRVTASAALTPLASTDLFATFTWTDDIRAKGSLDTVANGLTDAPRTSCAEQKPGPHCRVDPVKFHVPYQRELIVGGRYAARRVPRERALDPMRDEIWDVEVDASWAQTSRVDAYTLFIHDGLPGSAEERRISLNSGPSASVFALPKRAISPKSWRDSFGVRIGGDYNLIPSRLALRAGVAYDSSAVPTRNMSVDYWPVQRVTLSLGATAAFGRVQLTLAYAHVFYEDVRVPVGQGNVKDVAATFPDRGQPVNEGLYTASLDVLALQTNLRF